MARALAAPLLMPMTRHGSVVLSSMSSAAFSLTAPASAQDMICGGPKSLVCIFLAGGADTFNLFVPTDARFGQYQQTRGDMAVSESDLIDLGQLTSLAGSAAEPGETGGYGFHRQMATLARLHREGRCTVVANIGPLLRPTSPSDYVARRSLPESLFAHNSQQKLWQTSSGTVSGSTGFGWGGALAERLASCNAGSNVGGAFSMAGANAWQAAREARYSRR